MRKVDVTPAEWEIMRVLWANGEARSADIIKIFKEKRNWKPTTTKTLLSRLVDKSCVGTIQEGNRYRYRPLVTELDVWHSVTQELFTFVCDKDRASRIAEIIEAYPLSEADLAVISQSLERAEKRKVSQVECHCFKGQCRCHLQ